MSGTNAHVIVVEPPTVEAAAVAAVDLPLAPVLLSGTVEASVRAQDQQLIDSAEVGAAHPVALGAASLRRAALAHRAGVLAGDPDELMSGLEAGVAGAGGLIGTARAGRVGFLFPGQGAQRASLGRGLYEAFPV
ncbi:hypothetical protein, partial [Streptomyces sp. BE303]|uniref:hypothetical protein n=1 Tax=Streptomyces sp. BE303 TaxID=3002528 RepID=UPI002E762E0B